MENGEFYREIVQNLRVGVYFVDKQRRIQVWNHEAEKITGYTAEELKGKCCQNSGLMHVDQEGNQLCGMDCPLYHTLRDGKPRREHLLLRHKNGQRIPILADIVPIRKEKNIIGAVELFHWDSITNYKDDLIDQLSNAATHDDLTGLLNRGYLERVLSYWVEEFYHRGERSAVLFADVDNFSQVNNTYGHPVGDEVLKKIGETIHQTTRHNDIAGRWGGEEFLGIYRIDDARECCIIAERLRHQVSEIQVPVNGAVVKVTISVGITCIRNGDNVQSLLQRVDKLMYQGKKNGKNCVCCDIDPENESQG